MEKARVEGGVISETFFGLTESAIQYELQKGATRDARSVATQEVFAEILVNVVGISDLYEAWENMYENVIEDYLTPEQQVTKAKKVDWIKALPRVLFLQLNRLQIVDGLPVKVNSHTKIEKEVFPDRFLVEN